MHADYFLDLQPCCTEYCLASSTHRWTPDYYHFPKIHGYNPRKKERWFRSVVNTTNNSDLLDLSSLEIQYIGSIKDLSFERTIITHILCNCNNSCTSVVENMLCMWNVSGSPSEAQKDLCLKSWTAPPYQ